MDGIVIIARLGSSRLHQKHLIIIQKKPIIRWLIDRIIKEVLSKIDKKEVLFIIATADEGENRIFENIIQLDLMRVFYGSRENIPLRLLQCSKEFNLEHLVSVDGDDILCSPRAILETLMFLKSHNKYDVCRSTGLPLGMNVSAYTSAYLELAIDPNSGDKMETGWGRVFRNARTHTIKMGEYDRMKYLRFTLDYAEDVTFFESIIDNLREKVLSIPDEELIKMVIQNKYYEINEGLNKTYWQNFNNQLKAESK